MCMLGCFPASLLDYLVPDGHNDQHCLQIQLQLYDHNFMLKLSVPLNTFLKAYFSNYNKKVLPNLVQIHSLMTSYRH